MSAGLELCCGGFCPEELLPPCEVTVVEVLEVFCLSEGVEFGSPVCPDADGLAAVAVLVGVDAEDSPFEEDVTPELRLAVSDELPFVCIALVAACDAFSLTLEDELFCPFVAVLC